VSKLRRLSPESTDERDGAESAPAFRGGELGFKRDGRGDDADDDDDEMLSCFCIDFRCSFS